MGRERTPQQLYMSCARSTEYYVQIRVDAGVVIAMIIIYGNAEQRFRVHLNYMTLSFENFVSTDIRRRPTEFLFYPRINRPRSTGVFNRGLANFGTDRRHCAVSRS